MSRSTNPRAQDALRRSPMMAHLIDALESGKDVGHYGRLVFTMIARFFLEEQAVVDLLAKNPGVSPIEARALYLEVSAHDYNPPQRNRVLSWQRRQDFPICPNPDDPNGCDVYKELRFPDKVYDRIQEFYEDLARDEEIGSNADSGGADRHRSSEGETSEKSAAKRR